eukprot:scaffold183082_cov19-Tisochrysis_lutea.AAC.1
MASILCCPLQPWVSSLTQLGAHDAWSKLTWHDSLLLQVVLITSESSKSGTFFFFGGNNNTPNKDLTRTEKL